MNSLEIFARILLVLQGAFVIGVTVVAIPAYWKHPLIGHISAVAVSYCVVILVVTHSLYYEAYPRLSGKGAFVFLAYILGDYALLRIIVRHTGGTSGEQPPDFWRTEFRQAVRDVLNERESKGSILQPK